MRLVTSVLLVFVLFGATARPVAAQDPAPAKEEPDQGKEKPARTKQKPAPTQRNAAAVPRVYGHVNFGGQAGSHDFAQQGSFPLFDETATFGIGGTAGGGFLFDIGGGYRVWRRLYGGVSYSRSSDKGDAALAALSPHPLFPNRPQSFNEVLPGLKHVENAVHLQAVWRQPIKWLDVAAFVGPTIFSVDQDLVTNVVLTESGGNVSFGGAPTARSSETVVGFHIGVDGTYMVTRRFGIGVLMRFAAGSVDLPGSFGPVSLDVGGFQMGAGGRVRF